MGWAFYEVSGGADFKPEPPARLARAAASSQVAPEPETALATGATSTISNTSQATTHTTTSNSETTASIQSASLSSTVAFIPKTRRNTLLSLPIPTPGTTPFSIAPRHRPHPPLTKHSCRRRRLPPLRQTPSGLLIFEVCAHLASTCEMGLEHATAFWPNFRVEPPSKFCKNPAMVGSKSKLSKAGASVGHRPSFCKNRTD